MFVSSALYTVLSFDILLQSHKCVWEINKEALWFSKFFQVLKKSCSAKVKEISLPETELI